jgi:hypothetical protein
MINEDPDTQLLITCAVSYAIGRSTYIVDTVAEYIKRHWNELSPGYRETIARDVRRHVLGPRYSEHACDRQTWNGLDKWIRDQC